MQEFLEAVRNQYLNSSPQTSLIIGYGNTLRGDDGAGYRVAEKVATWIEMRAWTGFKSLAVHQLTPDLAAEMAIVDRVIFIDGFEAIDPACTPVEVLPITPEEKGNSLGHQGDPRSLLHLTQTLFNHCPVSYWILIPGVNFDFGETFSPTTEAAVQQVLDGLESWMNLELSFGFAGGF